MCRAPLRAVVCKVQTWRAAAFSSRAQESAQCLGHLLQGLKSLGVQAVFMKVRILFWEGWQVWPQGKQCTCCERKDNANWMSAD